MDQGPSASGNIGSPQCNDALLKSILDDLREVVFRVDPDGRLTFLNAAWVEITGYSVEDSLGRTFHTFLHPDDREMWVTGAGVLARRAQEVCRQEIRFLKNDG